MESLQNTLKVRLIQAGFQQEQLFLDAQGIVFTKNQKKYLHIINYFNQQIASESYLKFNDLCVAFNEQFQNEDQSEVTLEQKDWLQINGFEKIIEHLFSNEQLEMDFYPAIKGYYIKDKDNNHYMLVSFQKYDSNDFTGYKLIQFTKPSFSFAHQDNYIG